MTDLQNLDDLSDIFRGVVDVRREERCLLAEISYVIQEDFSMSAVTALQEAAVALRTATEGVATKVTELQTRLSNNPTEAEVQAVADELGAIGTQLSSVGATIDSIDPDQPGGVITDPEDPEAVVEEVVP